MVIIATQWSPAVAWKENLFPQSLAEGEVSVRRNGEPQMVDTHCVLEVLGWDGGVDVEE